MPTDRSAFAQGEVFGAAANPSVGWGPTDTLRASIPVPGARPDGIVRARYWMLVGGDFQEIRWPGMSGPNEGPREGIGAAPADPRPCLAAYACRLGLAAEEELCRAQGLATCKADLGRWSPRSALHASIKFRPGGPRGGWWCRPPPRGLDLAAGDARESAAACSGSASSMPHILPWEHTRVGAKTRLTVSGWRGPTRGAPLFAAHQSSIGRRRDF